jgi:hypothetical protein
MQRDEQSAIIGEGGRSACNNRCLFNGRINLAGKGYKL